MIAPFLETGWTFEELRKFLVEHESDPNADHLSVHLVNPTDREQIDDGILNVIMPQVEAAFDGTVWRFTPNGTVGKIGAGLLRRML